MKQVSNGVVAVIGEGIATPQRGAQIGSWGREAREIARAIDDIETGIRGHERLGRGRHVLLGFVDDGPAAVSLAEMLSLVRATFGESADGCAVVPQGGMPSVAPEDLPVLIDAEGGSPLRLPPNGAPLG